MITKIILSVRNLVIAKQVVQNNKYVHYTYFVLLCDTYYYVNIHITVIAFTRRQKSFFIYLYSRRRGV